MQALCGSCNESCIAKVVDNGIGWSDAWGVEAFDHKYDVESDCCYGECFDSEGNKLTVEDVKRGEF